MRDDVKSVLEEYEISTLMRAKGFKKISDVLKEDEEVLYISPVLIIGTPGTKKKDQLAGAIALTANRIIGVGDILGKRKIEEMNLKNITDIDLQNDGVNTYILVRSLTKTYKILSASNKKYHQKVLDLFKNTKNAFDGNNEFVSNNQTDDEIIEKIRKVAQLKDEGIISEEEFDIKKKELLSRI